MTVYQLLLSKKIIIIIATRNQKPTLLHVVLLNKNIPCHKHTFKYYPHDCLKKNVIQNKAT